MAAQIAKLLHPDDATAERIDAITREVLRAPRVIPLASPGRPTSGEAIRVRDAAGNVRTRVIAREHRYTTEGLVRAEEEVLDRTARRVGTGAAVIPEAIVERVLARYASLDADQQAALRGLCASGNGLDVVIGKAGTGKSAMLKAYRQACDEAGVQIRGVAPSATAAHLLGQSAEIAEPSTVHRVLAGLEHAGWKLPAGGVVVLDEAAMLDTRTLLKLQQAADVAGCKLVAVGDYRQTPSVDVGGMLPRIAETTSTFELTHNHRFDRIEMRDAAEQIRDGLTAEGIAGFRRLGMVYDDFQTADQCWSVMIGDWLNLRDHGADARLFADLNVNIDELNRQARHALVERGQVAKGRTYSDDSTGNWFTVGEGDRVRLGANEAGVAQLDGTHAVVRNGMEGQIIHTSGRGVEVLLDPEHVGDDGRASVWLPSAYVANELALGYALTCDKAQAATHDDALYLATDRASLERGYVALSRGRYSNRIYATRTAEWEEALGTSRAHEPAINQQPTPREQGVETERPIERQRDRWLAERLSQLEAERQAHQEGRDDDGRQHDEGRGRGMAM